MKHEDKQKICNLLLPALQATRGLHDLLSLEYDHKTEFVTAVFENGSKRINVNMDSGTAMISDIMRALA